MSGRRRWVRRSLALGLLVLALPLSACREADRFVQIAPRLIAPGSGPGVQVTDPLPPPAARIELPPEQFSDAFGFEAAGIDEAGNLRYGVRILAGGNPYLVAAARLTPLFRVDGKDAVQYVSEAYFRANPGRTPGSIQPGDEFTLVLPPGSFVVRWQEERTESFGHVARLREYVSERGDRLRFYLTDPFPLAYTQQRAEAPGIESVHVSGELAYLLGTGRTDLGRLAQLIYRVADPDIFQVESMRRLAAGLRPGSPVELELDRTHAYLDPVREALAQAERTEPVATPDGTLLTRALLSPRQGLPFLAVEDALGGRSNLDELPSGRAFRLTYAPNGTVQVYYKTGPDDALGKRDPYQWRDNDRWAALYQKLPLSGDKPVRWGPGEPSDLEPFPSARDPHQRSQEPDDAYAYLLPGRVVVLTFRPIRFQSDLRAEAEFRDLLRGVRERYRPQIDEAVRMLLPRDR